MGPINPDTTLVVPGGVPISWTLYSALQRYNLKSEAEEDDSGFLLSSDIMAQSEHDRTGGGGHYDDARPELA